MAATALPGLDRLLEIGRKHNFPLQTLPAGSTPPIAGELLLGMPFDPLLAAAYARFGRIVVGADNHLLMRRDDEVNQALTENREWQNSFPHDAWPEHFRALMIFGGEMLYRYATVPALADPGGRQPVVFLDPYEDIYALPVASTVDRFFDACSRHVELMAEDPEYKATGASVIGFPWRTPELIARDQPLIDMIKSGLFDLLLYERDKTGWRNENALADTRRWLSSVLRLAAG